MLDVKKSSASSAPMAVVLSKPENIFYRVRELPADDVLKELNGGLSEPEAVHHARQQDLMFFVAARNHDGDGSGTMAIASKLLTLGVKADRLDIHKQTPLFYAAREGNTECCELLIRQRCDVNQKDLYGQTPLFFAIKKSRTHTCRTLYLMGAELDVSDNEGRNVAWFCSEAMKLSLEAVGVPINAHLKTPGTIGAKVVLDSMRFDLRSSHVRTPSGTPARSPLTDYAESDDVISQVSSIGTTSQTSDLGPGPGKNQIVIARAAKVGRTSRAADVTQACAVLESVAAIGAAHNRMPAASQDIKDASATFLSLWAKSKLSYCPEVPVGDAVFAEMGSPRIGRYVIAKPSVQHAKRLRELEREFVADHYQLFSCEDWVKSTSIGDWCRMVNVILGEAASLSAIQRVLEGKMKTHVTLHCIYVPPEVSALGELTRGRPEIVGYVHFVCDEKDAYVDISHLKVCTKHGARGVGALLLAGMSKFASNELRRWSVLKDVRLVVMKANEIALKLYDSLGMHPSDKVMKSLRGGQIEWTKMRLPIGPDGISAVCDFLKTFCDQCNERASERWNLASGKYTSYTSV